MTENPEENPTSGEMNPGDENPTASEANSGAGEQGTAEPRKQPSKMATITADDTDFVVMTISTGRTAEQVTAMLPGYTPDIHAFAPDEDDPDGVITACYHASTLEQLSALLVAVLQLPKDVRVQLHTNASAGDCLGVRLVLPAADRVSRCDGAAGEFVLDIPAASAAGRAYLSRMQQITGLLGLFMAARRPAPDSAQMPAEG